MTARSESPLASAGEIRASLGIRDWPTGPTARFTRLVLIPAIPLLFLTALLPPAMAANVQNLSSGQEGDRVFVQYDLVGGLGEREVDVAVVLRIGGGTYPAGRLSLEGDFGKKVVPGPGKRFYWNVLKDFPGGFEGELTWEVTARATVVPTVAPTGAVSKASIQDGGKVAAPTFSPGDTWVFTEGNEGKKTFEERYIGEEQVLLVFDVKSDGKEFRRYRTRDGNFVRDEEGGRYAEPDNGLLEFPLHLGKKWRAIYYIRTTPEGWASPMLAFKGLNGNRRNGYKVTAWEKVKTPAGEFEAFRIEGTDELQGAYTASRQDISIVMWYAPAIKRIVKSRGTTDRGGFDVETLTYELVSYNLR